MTIKVEFDVVPFDHNGEDDVWSYDNLREALQYAASELGQDSTNFCKVDHKHDDGSRSLYTAFEIICIWGNGHTPPEAVDAILNTQGE